MKYEWKDYEKSSGFIQPMCDDGRIKPFEPLLSIWIHIKEMQFGNLSELDL